MLTNKAITKNNKAKKSTKKQSVDSNKKDKSIVKDDTKKKAGREKRTITDCEHT